MKLSSIFACFLFFLSVMLFAMPLRGADLMPVYVRLYYPTAQQKQQKLTVWVNNRQIAKYKKDVYRCTDFDRSLDSIHIEVRNENGRVSDLKLFQRNGYKYDTVFSLVVQPPGKLVIYKWYAEHTTKNKVELLYKPEWLGLHAKLSEYAAFLTVEKQFVEYMERISSTRIVYDTLFYRDDAFSPIDGRRQITGSYQVFSKANREPFTAQEISSFQTYIDTCFANKVNPSYDSTLKYLTAIGPVLKFDWPGAIVGRFIHINDAEIGEGKMQGNITGLYSYGYKIIRQNVYGICLETPGYPTYDIMNVINNITLTYNMQGFSTDHVKSPYFQGN